METQTQASFLEPPPPLGLWWRRFHNMPHPHNVTQEGKYLKQIANLHFTVVRLKKQLQELGVESQDDSLIAEVSMCCKPKALRCFETFWPN